MKRKTKEQAIRLRKKGYSFKEIGKKLKISKSTASLWLRNIELSDKAKDRIFKLGVKGREKAARSVSERIFKENAIILKSVKDTLIKSTLLNSDLKIICALLYWCEGGKTDKSKISFINSDPKLVKFFINTFRNAFNVNESKFRALIHIHSYHDINQQTKFWSNVTGIPISHFTKPFKKTNRGKRKKDNYQGCISIRYYGRKVIKEMMFLIQEISK